MKGISAARVTDMPHMLTLGENESQRSLFGKHPKRFTRRLFQFQITKLVCEGSNRKCSGRSTEFGALLCHGSHRGVYLARDLKGDLDP